MPQRKVSKTVGERIRELTRSRESRTPTAKPANASCHAAWATVGPQYVYFRSRWEANYARYLEWLRRLGKIRKWEHEPETFYFQKIKRGCVSYLPDFRVTCADGSIEYHEVKGWMNAKSKTKLKRMAKYHPEVKLIVIDSKIYRVLEKTLSTIIPEWERSPRK